ncbi:MAG: hypothetical protein ACW98F_10865 [Candidatus Hodarchaeales archaeon]|jgi:hypothetical protein
MRLYIHFLTLFLLICFSLTAYSFAGDKKTYTNTQYNFTFAYPSSYQLKKFGEGYFDILQNGNIALRGSIEDNSFKIFIHESKSTGDVFRKFARERCKIVCGADGPDGSTYCDEIKSQREYVSANGFRVLEFYLTMTRENYSRKTKSKSTVGPVSMVDISRPDHPLALMIHPGHGTLGSERAKRLAVEMIDSIKLMQ